MVAGFFVATAGLLFWAFGEMPAVLFFNSTASLPTGLYVVRDISAEVGDIIAVCLGEEASALALARGYLGAGDCLFGTAPAGKAWAAGSGDTVTVTTAGVWIGAQLLPHSRPLETDRNGYLLPAVYGKVVLGPGEVWLYSGYDERSFDSRYFGPVHVSQIRGKVTPLWVRQKAYNPLLDLPSRGEKIELEK